MKLLAFIFLSFISMNYLNSQTPVQLKIDGMSCGFCVNAVSKKLSSIKTIENIQIDLPNGLANFTVKKGAKVDKKQYEMIIEKSGYELREIKVGDEILHNHSSTLNIQDTSDFNEPPYSPKTINN
ncbi:MAG TPA: heavy-metal-associated domain-containing protein [Saprospiraceae bacterium]|jgi:copper chaperone CopZ|nr:heavy-metal-associated domain-containing protein [Saprospiraceae bacterium]